MAKSKDHTESELANLTSQESLAGETDELDPEFEAALTAALALDAIERIEKLSQLASALKEDLDSSR